MPGAVQELAATRETKRRTGLELSLLGEVGDRHNEAPRSFTFATQTAIAEAIARTQPQFG